MKIRTRAYQDGFRRAGVAHSTEWQTWPADRFSSEQVEQLHEEPGLMMEIIVEPGDHPQEILGDELPELAEDQAPTDGEQPEAEAEAEPDQASDIVAAARQAVAEGQTIASGAPSVDALQEILGRDVTSAERDEAWDSIMAEA